MSILDLIALLVSLAAIFTFINIHYLKLSTTIGLMILALGMSISILGIGVLYPPIREVAENIMKNFDFTEVLLNVMLSFLLFAGAMHVDIQKLKEGGLAVGLLALFGTLISTIVVGTLMYYVLNGLLGFEKM